jgi:thiol:disulfide interchange protein DsbD
LALSGFGLTVAGLPTPAIAAVVDTGHVKAELIVSGEAVPGGEVLVALRQTIAKDWHTYWRNPGDAGQATTLDWRLPSGWQAGQIIWPTPKRLPLGTLMNYGYEGEALLPVSITVPADAKPGQRLTLKAEAGFLVCKDICIPEQASLTAEVVVASGAPKIDAKAAKAISRVAPIPPKAVPTSIPASAMAKRPSAKSPAISSKSAKGASTMPRAKLGTSAAASKAEATAT